MAESLTLYAFRAVLEFYYNFLQDTVQLSTVILLFLPLFMEYRKILIVQTAFIGDVVLATPLIEQLDRCFPEAAIDFLLRKGNQNLLERDPRINELHIWDKKKGKNRELFRLIRKIRSKRYDLVINAQRFASMGLLTLLSGARQKIGFNKNPFSFGFDISVPHEISENTHEVSRNLRLLENICTAEVDKPSIHLPEDIIQAVERFKRKPYLTIAPTSVWFTKQFPAEKWVRFLSETQFKGPIYLLGGPSDSESCEKIIEKAENPNLVNLCGYLSLIESIALMKDAVMNFMNDSAPLHFASAVNANSTAVFCSTVPGFGFGPLSDDSMVVETDQPLDCRPCGLHGFSECPKGHFKCANTIDVRRLEERLIAK